MLIAALRERAGLVGIVTGMAESYAASCRAFTLWVCSAVKNRTMITLWMTLKCTTSFTWCTELSASLLQSTIRGYKKVDMLQFGVESGSN